MTRGKRRSSESSYSLTKRYFAYFHWDDPQLSFSLADAINLNMKTTDLNIKIFGQISCLARRSPRQLGCGVEQQESDTEKQSQRCLPILFSLLSSTGPLFISSRSCRVASSRSRSWSGSLAAKNGTLLAILLSPRRTIHSSSCLQCLLISWWLRGEVRIDLQ